MTTHTFRFTDQRTGYAINVTVNASAYSTRTVRCAAMDAVAAAMWCFNCQPHHLTVRPIYEPLRAVV